MDIRKLYTAMWITIVLMLFVMNRAHAAVPNSVYSVVSNPVFTETGATVTTITRGTAANQAVYKATVQTVSKALLLSTFRTAVKFTPYGIAALGAWAVYDYYINDETGELEHTVSVGFGTCWQWRDLDGNVSINHGSLSYTDCLSVLTPFIPAGYHVEYLNNRFELYNDATGYKISGNSLGYLSPTSYVDETVSVSDDDLYQKIQDYVSDNPNIDHSQLFYDQYGQVNQDYFPDPVFYDVSPEDQTLIDLYGSGLLQSTDPQAANYVTPEEYQRIADLYDYQNRTLDEIADDLTADATEPMTRAEYAEEQVLKEDRMSASAESMKDVDLSGLDKTTEMNDNWDLLDNLIQNPSDLPSSLPTVPQLPYTASCQTIELGYGKVFPTANQCSQLNTAKDLIGYFLYVCFFWLITIELFKEAN